MAEIDPSSMELIGSGLDSPSHSRSHLPSGQPLPFFTYQRRTPRYPRPKPSRQACPFETEGAKIELRRRLSGTGSFCRLGMLLKSRRCLGCRRRTRVKRFWAADGNTPADIRERIGPTRQARGPFLIIFFVFLVSSRRSSFRNEHHERTKKTNYDVHDASKSPRFDGLMD